MMERKNQFFNTSIWLFLQPLQLHSSYSTFPWCVLSFPPLCFFFFLELLPMCYKQFTHFLIYCLLSYSGREFLRRLRTFNICRKLRQMFYRTAFASVLSALLLGRQHWEEGWLKLLSIFYVPGGHKIDHDLIELVKTAGSCFPQADLVLILWINMSDKESRMMNTLKVINECSVWEPTSSRLDSSAACLVQISINSLWIQPLFRFQQNTYLSQLPE